MSAMPLSLPMFDSFPQRTEDARLADAAHLMNQTRLLEPLMAFIEACGAQGA